MTLPDTGPERPGGMASDTREMADEDAHNALHGGGPRGRVVLILGAAIAIGVMAWLLLRG